MYFWNVVLSYTRSKNGDSHGGPIRLELDDLELGEHLAPTSEKNTAIYKQKTKVHSKQVQRPKNVPASSRDNKQKHSRTGQDQKAHGNTPSHYYQTPTDQKNYHML